MSCDRPLEPGQGWAFCGETDMIQTEPVLCAECGGDYKLAEETPPDRDPIMMSATIKIKIPPGHTLITWPDGSQEIMKVVNPYSVGVIKDLGEPS